MTCSIDPEKLASVTVTYNPDLTLLSAQLLALPEGCVRIIVDNASRPDLVAGLESIVARMPNLRMLRNETNIGLAAAINQGVAELKSFDPKPGFVLFLDQDSEPENGSVERLVTAFKKLEQGGHRVGCVGPVLFDPRTGLTHGFHQCTRWRWKRVHPPLNSVAPVECANLNGSGTLTSLALFLELGGLDVRLFIDHVDTEWSFRALAAGYELWGIPNAIFRHRMGQDSIRWWLFRWRVWPSRPPQRHYFLFRNAVFLMRRRYVPRVWKFWALVKLGLTATAHILFDGHRIAQAKNMLQGFREGMRDQ